MTLFGGLLILTGFTFALWKISQRRKAKNRRPLKIHNGVTPEEQELHFDELRRKLSAEMKKRRDEQPKP